MPKVTIYTTPTCPYCQTAKEFLKQKSIEYNEVDVSSDPKAADEMIKKSGQMGVPVMVIEKEDQEEIITGFDPAKISQVLGLT